MDTITRDILDFVAGRLTPEGEQRLASALKAQDASNAVHRFHQGLLDGEECRVTEVVATDRQEEEVERKTDDRRELHRSIWHSAEIRRWAQVAAALVVVALVSFGTAWAFFVRHPLLKDNFNDQWFNGRMWMAPHAGVKELSGYLRLSNRGYVVTADDYAPPVQLCLDWRWIDLAEAPQYTDHLSIVLRTTGRPRPEHSFEAIDGVIVNIDAQAGSIHIGRLSGRETGPHAVWIGSTERKVPPLPDQLTDPLRGPLPIPANTWHSIRVVDDGTTISVYFSESNVDRKYGDAPVLQVTCPEKFPGAKIAIYNRELVAGVPHQSHIDNVAVYELEEE